MYGGGGGCGGHHGGGFVGGYAGGHNGLSGVPGGKPKPLDESVKGKLIDLWYSGKAGEHGGNIQALSGPTGFPLWVSEVLWTFRTRDPVGSIPERMGSSVRQAQELFSGV